MRYGYGYGVTGAGPGNHWPYSYCSRLALLIYRPHPTTHPHLKHTTTQNPTHNPLSSLLHHRARLKPAILPAYTFPGPLTPNHDTEKHSEAGQDDRFLFGVSEMQGWRISMEDAHAIELNLEDKSGGHNAFFAVYDGHGGGTVAKFSGQNVHKRLINEPMYAQHQWKDALKRAFLGTDDDIRAEQRFFRDPSGCTAVAALVTDDGWIVVANAGDSRAVLSVKGEVLPLSYDHKPVNESELSRIRNAGGYVEYGRVNGNLALSRAIGDFEFKKNAALSPEEQIITANPDVTEHKITEEDEFFVLACDDIVRLQVSQRKELTQIAEFLCDLCLAPDTTSRAGIGCDNMTVLIVAILNGRTKEQWYDWMEDRVKRNYGHPTPVAVPQLWSASRINAFHARRAAQEERQARDLLAKDESGSEEGSDNGVEGGIASVFGGRALGPGGTLSGFARSMLGTGITFHPSSGINSDDGTLMFAPDDSDEENGDEMDTGDGFVPDGGDLFDENSTEHQFLTALGLRPPVSDMTKSLRAQLEELEESDERPGTSRIEEVDGTTSPKEQGSSDEEDDEEDNEDDDEEDDEDNLMSNPGDEAQQAFGAAQKSNLSNGISTKVVGSSETPPPPASLVNGDIKVKQLSSTPGGDEASPVVKAEGLMDGSESPFKG
ncbi:PP2C-domain-containing protein [Sanghuangporus baumii]|uniref:protein-serine/threonine phosphatase n=1 Tax=Sanghuangporus baumii TaxID=108892 RepID=A0A9Q5NDJ9_SANBA|nr:PP2C-domain-containing protein [Sanghuangporus baumii]